MRILTFILLTALISCSKEKEIPTPSPKQPTRVKWETFGKSGIKNVTLNNEKMTIGVGYDLNPGDRIGYIIEATGTKVVFQVIETRTSKVLFADSNQFTFFGSFIY